MPPAASARAVHELHHPRLPRVVASSERGSVWLRPARAADRTQRGARLPFRCKRRRRRVSSCLQGVARSASRELPLDDPTFLESRFTSSDVLATWPEFPITEIGLRLRGCREHVNICITASPLLDLLVNALRQALANGRHVEIALWDPQSEFCQAPECLDHPRCRTVGWTRTTSPIRLRRIR